MAEIIDITQYFKKPAKKKRFPVNEVEWEMECPCGNDTFKWTDIGMVCVECDCLTEE